MNCHAGTKKILYGSSNLNFQDYLTKLTLNTIFRLRFDETVPDNVRKWQELSFAEGSVYLGLTFSFGPRVAV